MKIPLIVSTLLVAIAVACSGYQGPPGGDQAYCWRVEQESRSESWLHVRQTIVFYTNVEPVQQGDSLLLLDAWWATDTKNLSQSRFDRFESRIVISALGAEVESLCQDAEDSR